MTEHNSSMNGQGETTPANVALPVTAEAAEVVNEQVSPQLSPAAEEAAEKLDNFLTSLDEIADGVEASESLPRIDPVRGVFICSNHEEVELSDRPVNQLIVERLVQDGKPKIPMTEVTLLGKQKHLQPNPNDPGYKQQLEEWESESYVRMLKFLFNVGVKGQPPQEFVDTYLGFFPGATDPDLKYLWVCSKVPESDMNDLATAIMGRTLPTIKGVGKAANFTK